MAKKHNLDVQVSCYTFGAPRVGNHAFAEDFDSIINDCFHVVNHQVRNPLWHAAVMDRSIGAALAVQGY